MKKFLSFALVAMLIVATVAITASAVSFVKGDGYDVYSGADYSNSEAVGKSPVTMESAGENAVTVKQGGYYKNYKGDNNFGGVATKEKVGLDGLVVTVDFKKAPTPTNDCWFGILLQEEARVFNTGDMASNGGWNPLIRFNVPNLEYHGDMFSNDTGNSGTHDDGMFGIQSGDTIKMSVEYKLGQYIVTYDHNGRTFEVPANYSLSASNRLLEDGGKAHVVVTGTLLGDQCDWEYTVTVEEGEGVSAEDLANREFEQSKLAAVNELNGYADQIVGYNLDCQEAVGEFGLTYPDVQEQQAKAEEVVTKFEALEAALEAAADKDAVDAVIAEAKALVGEMKAIADEVVYLSETEDFSVEYSAEAADEEVADEEVTDEEVTDEEAVEDAEAEAETEAPAEEGGMPVWVWILIAVAVVVVVLVVLLVVLKKKKN